MRQASGRGDHKAFKDALGQMVEIACADGILILAELKAAEFLCKLRGWSGSQKQPTGVPEFPKSEACLKAFQQQFEEEA